MDCHRAKEKNKVQNNGIGWRKGTDCPILSEQEIKINLIFCRNCGKNKRCDHTLNGGSALVACRPKVLNRTKGAALVE